MFWVEQSSHGHYSLGVFIHFRSPLFKEGCIRLTSGISLSRLSFSRELDLRLESRSSWTRTARAAHPYAPQPCAGPPTPEPRHHTFKENLAKTLWISQLTSSHSMRLHSEWCSQPLQKPADLQNVKSQWGVQLERLQVSSRWLVLLQPSLQSEWTHTIPPTTGWETFQALFTQKTKRMPVQ